MSIDEYRLHADNKACEMLIREQWVDAYSGHQIACGGGCNTRHDIQFMYRCLYCGVWFCFACGEKHFGKTFQEHLGERRRRIREALNKD